MILQCEVEVFISLLDIVGPGSLDGVGLPNTYTILSAQLSQFY